MLHRVLEPEVMSDWDDADCYDQMDHQAVNNQFAIDLIEAAEKANAKLGPDICDIGTGTALIPIELCKRVPKIRVMAVDASVSMLEFAKCRIEVAGMRDRIQLAKGDANALEFADKYFDTLMSNSIVHHLASPQGFFQQCARLCREGGLIFVRDLLRPQNLDELEALVQTYTKNEMPIAQQLLRQSLHAALSLAEVEELVTSSGMDATNLSATSDRHWTWYQRT
jgi:ubiquinone/menaquinone biosynthesis C-methylase UbiE